jgi:septal ring factor EnvC (AmiA/AmiB activator)
VPFLFSLPLLWTVLPSDLILFDYLLLGMTRQIAVLEEKHSRDQAEMAQRCADFEEKYSQSQTELNQVSAALDDANALSSSLHARLDSEKVTYKTVPCLAMLLLLAWFLKELIFCLQEEKRILAASRDNLDRLYRDSSNSLTILERSHRFTMEELDNQRCRLQESADEVTRLKQLISAKDATIKELRASKKSIAQELEAARLAVKVAEETAATLKAQRDKAMDKAIRAGRILMRRPGVVVPEDIKADVNAAPDSSSRPTSSVAPEKDIAK